MKPEVGDGYLRGQLMKIGRKTLGGADDTYAVTNSWRDIQNNAAATMTLSYTPPVDCWISFDLQGRFATNTAARSVEMHIWDGGAEVNWGRYHFARTNKSMVVILHGLKELTADTAYTFQFRFRLPAGEAQTITTYVAIQGITMDYEIKRKP